MRYGTAALSITVVVVVVVVVVVPFLVLKNRSCRRSCGSCGGWHCIAVDVVALVVLLVVAAAWLSLLY